jgi:hypothetical protein
MVSQTGGRCSEELYKILRVDTLLLLLLLLLLLVSVLLILIQLLLLLIFYCITTTSVIENRDKRQWGFVALTTEALYPKSWH